MIGVHQGDGCVHPRMTIFGLFGHVLVNLCAILIFATFASADYPELRTYHVACDPDSLNHILENPDEDIYISCEFVYAGQVWHEARMRLRGDSSRGFPKKSFKVNFDADERFGDRDKVNLNAEWLDPSFCQEYLSYDFFRRAGLDASRAWFVKFYINEEYMGVYVDVEQVDEHFLAGVALDNASSLYKATYDGAMLRADEKLDSLWEKKTNEDAGFYDLAELRRWVNTVPEERFYDELGSVFDREQLARHMAVNTLIANSSTYYHNYYLVHDLNPDGRWRIIPWDMDRSFRYWGTFNSKPEYYFSSTESMYAVNPLVMRCFSDDQMRDEIFSHVVNLADSLITAEYYEPLIFHLDSLLTDAVLEDDKKKFSYAEFEDRLLNIPDEVLERADFMRSTILNGPYPFTLNPGQVSPSGVQLSWSRSDVPGDVQANYSVYVADNTGFYEAQIHDVGLDTFLVLSTLPDSTWYWYPIAEANGFVTRSSQQYEGFFSKPSVEDQHQLETDITGTVQLNPENGPLWITEDVTVHEGAILILQPGMHLAIAEGASLVVNGNLRFEGTENDPISFGSITPESESGQLVVHGWLGRMTASHLVIDAASTGGLIHVEAGANATLDSCEMDFHWGSGIILNDGSLDMTASRITCRTNPAILQQSGRLFIEQSSITSTSTSAELVMIDISSSDVDIRESELYGTEGTLLRLRGGSSTLTVTGSLLLGGTTALSLSNVLDGTVTNTRISLSERAMSVGDHVTMDIYNSTISRCGTGVELSEEYWSNSHVNLLNTVFYRSDRVTYPYPNNAVNIAYCFVDNDFYTWMGKVTGDPGVIDAWNGNWVTTSLSPLIDAGWGTGHPEFDLLGRPRVDTPSALNRGAGEIDYVDIGQYEYYEGFVPEPPEPDPDFFIAYPNPNSGIVHFMFDSIDGANAQLRITNVLGQLVYKAAIAGIDRGRQTLVWQGLDQYGNDVGSGMYFCTLERNSGSQTVRVVVLK
jgi:spore coat protein CotH